MTPDARTAPLLEPGTHPVADVASAILDSPRRARTLLVGIDGAGGSGKSTLARAIERSAGDVTVVEIDDFYFPSADRPNDPNRIGGDFDVERVRDQLLAPLAADEPGRYQRYDWDADALAEWHDVPVGGVVVLEGIYSTMDLLRPYLDVTLLVQTDRDERLRRGIARDGEDSRTMWEDVWMPAEDRYLDGQRPDLAADVVVDGGTGLTDDSLEVVVLPGQAD